MKLAALVLLFWALVVLALLRRREQPLEPDDYSAWRFV